MRRSRLRLYCLLSLLVHALCLWLFRFVPVSTPATRPPVAIRLLETPPALRAKPTPVPERQRPLPPPRAQTLPPPAPQPPPPAPPTPPLAKQEPPPPPKPLPPPKQGGIVAEIPKPQRQERPDKARILSEYDSKAQDGTGGEAGARKPSGERPPDLPPELPLPERYSHKGPKQERPESPPASAAPSPAPSRVPPAAASSETKVQAKATPPVPQKPLREAPAQAPKPLPAPQKPAPSERSVRKEQRLAESSEGPVPVPKSAAERDKRSASRSEEPLQTPPPRPPRDNTAVVTPPAERHFSLTAQQEVAMLQRPPLSASQPSKSTLEEHLARVEQRLPLFSFDTPATYARGEERPGEGQAQSGGGKYRSIDAYGIKHFSYLMQLKRKIELVFSVPPFASNRGKIGIPIVGFTVRRNGELAEAVVLHSSGYPEFDQAVVRAIRRAAPYYPFPEHLPDQEISVQVFVTLS